MTPNARRIYNFERGLQAPALEMMLRGISIDEIPRREQIERIAQTVARLQTYLDQLAMAVWGIGLNPNSSKQLLAFFYSVLKVKPQYKFYKGKRTQTCNREALEKLQIYFHARPFCKLILALRDQLKLRTVLLSGVDSDGRIRASYNVAGTETGRWSSSENAFGTGTNLQNITENLRYIFIADPGMKIAYCDLEQAESRAVGMICLALFGDSRYIDACESGDLHTSVCKMAWPDLPWPGTPSGDREVADTIFYRDFSYRDMAKRGGHGTNYRGQPPTMARHLKVEPKIIETFQHKYFTAFPAIQQWHHHVVQQLQLHGKLTTFLGRTRHFFGRLNDDTTAREAIAYEPQSVVGEVMNLGIYNLQKSLASRIHLLAQIHDAVMFQYPEEEESTILPLAISALRVPLTIASRTFTIPIEPAVGWNWGKCKTLKNGQIQNPDGLLKWKGQDSRKRIIRHDTPLLHRFIR